MSIDSLNYMYIYKKNKKINNKMGQQVWLGAIH